MKTSGFLFIFHITPLFIPQVEKHFGKKVFQIFLFNCPGWRAGVKFYVRDVESGGELVGGRVCGVDVYFSETLDSVGGAQEACHSYLVSVGTTFCKGVNEITSDVVEEDSRFRHEKREGVGKSVHFIEVVAFDMYYRASGEIRRSQRGHGFYAELSCRFHLNMVAVVKNFWKSSYVSDAYAVRESSVRLRCRSSLSAVGNFGFAGGGFLVSAGA